MSDIFLGARILGRAQNPIPPPPPSSFLMRFSIGYIIPTRNMKPGPQYQPWFMRQKCSFFPGPLLPIQLYPLARHDMFILTSSAQFPSASGRHYSSGRFTDFWRTHFRPQPNYSAHLKRTAFYEVIDRGEFYFSHSRSIYPIPFCHSFHFRNL